MHRTHTHRTLLAVVMTLGLLVVPGLAAARASAPTVKNGYYGNLVGVPSSEVTFHVRHHNRVPDLELGCLPVNQSYPIVSTDIGVHAPGLRISHGRFSYHGPATVTGDYYGAPKVDTTTLTIRAHHVNGPVHHYMFEGHHLTQMTAWKGTVSSPACASLPKGGAFTLFGPIPGE